MRWRLESIALLLVMLLATSCATVRGERVEFATSAHADPTETTSLPAQAMGDATLVDQVDGNGAFAFTAFELSTRNPLSGFDLVGDGKALITFVVPSCPVCTVEGPEIARSASANPDVTFVVVHSGGTTNDYEQYVATAGLTADNVVHIDDSPGVLWARFGIIQQPSNIVVDADGGVSQSLGALGEEGLQRVVAGM